MRRLRLTLLLALLPLAGGCFAAGRPVFLPAGGADGDGPLPRPVVVVGGYGDLPGFGTIHLGRELREATGDERVLEVRGGFDASFADAAERVGEAADAAFGEGAEVDVVGISAGGLIARHAIAAGRLNAARLFTVVTPHGGANLADDLAWADVLGNGREMRSASGYYAELAAMEESPANPGRGVPIVAYAREHDRTIGRGAELPPHLWDRGQVIWLDYPWYANGHAAAYGDRRIIGDVARRLRSPR